MAKRGGFPGGMGMPGNMNNLMKQAQKMQRQMEEGQKELETKEFSDIEMLQDLIMAATNEALRMADEANNELMGKMTGGLGGGFPF